jgi:hypothetical protein
MAKKNKLTLTLDGVCQLFRDHGVPMEKGRLARDLASGDVYPFGRVVKTSATGRRTFEIWRKDVEEFLASKS